MNPSSFHRRKAMADTVKFRRTGKMTLLFTIMCVSALNGMEPEKPTYEETYGSLPAELKQYIINTALATSNNLPDAIKAIKAFSALHGINYNNTDLVNVLMKKFPATVKDVIVVAVEKPELYLKIDTLYKENRWAVPRIMHEENILQDNLKDYTALMHILENFEDRILKKQSQNGVGNVAGGFTYTPLRNKFWALGVKLVHASNAIEAAELLNQDADINYSSSNVDYHTPLNKAAMVGNVELVKFLLNAGANPYLIIRGTYEKFLWREAGTTLDLVLKQIEEQKQKNNPNPVYSERLETIKTLLKQAMQSVVAQNAL